MKRILYFGAVSPKHRFSVVKIETARWAVFDAQERACVWECRTRKGARDYADSQNTKEFLRSADHQQRAAGGILDASKQKGGAKMRRWLKAVLTVSLIATAATAQTPEPNLQADLALAAARLAEATEPAPEPCAWRYVTNPDMDADAIELAPEEQVQPEQFFSTPPLERPRGTPEDVVPVRVFQFREEGWKFWGWLLLPMKDVLELHEDLVTA